MTTTTMNTQCHEYNVLSSETRAYRQGSQMLPGGTNIFYPKRPRGYPALGVALLGSKEMKSEALVLGREMLLMLQLLGVGSRFSL